MGLNNFTQGQPKKAPKKQAAAGAQPSPPTSPLRGAPVQNTAVPYQGILPPAAQRPGASGTFAGPHGPVTVDPSGAIDIPVDTLSAACAAATAAQQAFWGGTSPLDHPMAVAAIAGPAFDQMRTYSVHPDAIRATETAVHSLGRIDYAIAVSDAGTEAVLEVPDPAGGQVHVVTIDATTVVWEQASPSGTLTFSRPLSASVIVDIVKAARAGTTQQFGPVTKP